MMQFSAILSDTWHLIRARKLFWIALVITLLIGAVYVSLGYNEDGYSLFFVLNVRDAGLARGTPGAAATSFDAFYTVTKWWTTFFGMILALITCASIFPEFMAAGSIDTLLSKPISRGRLFLAKFVSGLLFAAVQVILLALMVLAAIRWRLGFWHWPVLWSVPLVVVFFSYLFAVCVFFGVWTRSTLAALTLTLIVWAGCGTLAITENFAAGLSQTSAAVTLGGSEGGSQAAAKFHRVVRGMMAVLPKTSETTELVERSVMRESDKSYLREREIERGIRSSAGFERMSGKTPEPASVARERLAKDLGIMDELKKSPSYIIGTSLVFETLVLALGCWMFSRRDY